MLERYHGNDVTTREGIMDFFRKGGISRENAMDEDFKVIWINITVFAMKKTRSFITTHCVFAGM